MTIFRFELALLVLAAIPSSGAAARQSIGASCDNVDPFVERECVDRRIEAKKRRLASLYTEALTAVRGNFARYGSQDNRSNPDYLMRSQMSWTQFVDNDCKVQAAFGGGSNSSISERETGCYEDALDRRIEFLEQLADGSFGTG
ncbi:lysozyme inhibitor LprI family protein [Sphingomonas sp. HF-S4]|uniref:Lysozyme inhibitor LprI family protein n=1 Tax=Sphingomonas agrestis TaxID=3080540 RepID=A0ABU3Y4I2_9SPHN|nr:lysozyme inhibitor LprI family protein [Sphingomonas sp. HF-S4]MDV3456304.1 lysozyme inhibitor LprI family protein [Sphingomonas sp. HF-S4]